jgi:hypothetical protein
MTALSNADVAFWLAAEATERHPVAPDMDEVALAVARIACDIDILNASFWSMPQSDTPMWLEGAWQHFLTASQELSEHLAQRHMSARLIDLEARRAA